MADFTLVLISLLVLLAVAGALRWDTLKLWWGGLFEAVPPGHWVPPPAGHHRPAVPQRLHEAARQRRSPPRRPGFHRSGHRSHG